MHMKENKKLEDYIRGVEDCKELINRFLFDIYAHVDVEETLKRIYRKMEELIEEAKDET